MKLTAVCCGLLISIVPLAGCNTPPPAHATVDTIDASQFRPAFSSAAPEIKALVDDVMMSIQDSNLTKALVDLDKLANNPSLTDPQKKVVNDLAEQVKK